MTSSLNSSSNPTDIGSTIIDILEHRATYQSDRLAYEFYTGKNKPYERLTYRELTQTAKAIASELIAKNLVKERVLLVYPAGLEFVAAFLGCLYAGAIAVPVYPPRHKGRLSRLKNIVDNCSPKSILTTSDLAAKVKSYFLQLNQIESCIVTDRIVVKDRDLKLPNISSEQIALLQYTSGSTGNPKGVIINHKNITHNSALIYRCFEHTANSKVVSWLPFYHDMGLIGGILQPLYAGFPVSLFSATDFLRQPFLWLETISKVNATTSGAPNFAYEMCVEKITPEAKKKLDLSSWDLAFIGAEPVRAETLDRFSTAFAECGFKKSAFYPCYGMAEATLMVTGGTKKNLFKTNKYTNKSFVGCGKATYPGEVLIVNSASRETCADNEIGEVWIENNDSIAQGYWNNQQLTRKVFNARLNNKQKNYLRTGDLGFIEDRELFITGRIKDLIIIRGQNYYPQDIEKIVERSHSALRANSGAAFSVEIDGQEQLVIVQEVERSFVKKLWGRQQVDAIRDSSLQKEEIESAIRAAVSQEFGLNVYDVRLIKTGSISKTSSGKIQRYLCKEMYLDGGSPKQRTCPHVLASSSGQRAKGKRKQQHKVKSIIDWLRSYAEEHINSQLIDERRCIPPYIVLDFGNQGLLGMQVPPEYGGLGLNNHQTMQILEQLGAIDTTLCLFVGLNNILGIRPLLNYGSEELKQELLPILATGRELAAFSLTEKGAGSNPQAIISQATATGENTWNIQGEKIWSGSAAWAGITNVFVQHQDLNGSHKGISAFAVRRGTPGLRQGKEALTMGMRGMVQNTVYLDRVSVTSQQLLGKPGKGIEVAQDAMMYGRLAIAFSCLGGMKRCAQLMLRYTSRRQVSTGRLLDNPVILNRLGELTAQITAVECLVTQIAELLDEGVAIPVELYTACKTSAPEFYWQAADSLVQFWGGRGYIETNIAPQILRDARVLRIFEGPTETLNMFLGSRIVHGAPEFAAFIQDRFKVRDIHQQLVDAIARINKHFQDNPVFDRSIDNKRWIYSLVGEVATYAILLAATKHSYQQNSTEELNRAVSWAELQFEGAIAKAIASQELVTQEADATKDLIESYENAIGDIQQNLGGEEREIDELALKDTAASPTHRGRSKGELYSHNTKLPQFYEAVSNRPSSLPSLRAVGEGDRSIPDWLSQWLSNKLQLPLDKIDRTKAFADYGIDSVMAVELAQDLQEWLPEDLEIEPTLAWSFPSIEALAGYLGSQKSGVTKGLPACSQKSGVTKGLPACSQKSGVTKGLPACSQKSEEEKPVAPDNADKSKIRKETNIEALSEDELARSLLQEIALAKGRDN